MKKCNLKKENGFATSDALIAVLIVVLFSGLIATLTYNIYLANTSTKRINKASGYITDVFEYVDKLYYDDIKKENLVTYFNNKYYLNENADVKMQEDANEELNTPFKVYIEISNFYPEDIAEQNRLDLVKVIKIRVNYKLGSREQNIEMTKVKSRENIITPNSPDMNLLQMPSNMKGYPIKNIDKDNNIWKVCNQNDYTWYNYNVNEQAIMLITNRELNIGDQINANNLSSIEVMYKWIPRYAQSKTNANDIIYLFSNTSMYVETQGEYNKLLAIDENNYEISAIFTLNGDITGIWEEYNI